jgi:hypothetical protein
MRSSQLIDGKIWDGSDPGGYARSFRLHALAITPAAKPCADRSLLCCASC